MPFYHAHLYFLVSTNPSPLVDTKKNLNKLTNRFPLATFNPEEVNMTPRRPSARNNCEKHKKTSKPARKRKRQPKKTVIVVALDRYSNKPHQIGEPLTNERAAIRRAKGTHQRNPWLTIGVASGGRCVFSVGPDEDAIRDRLL